MENNTTATTVLPLEQLYAQGQYSQFITKVMEAQSQYSPAQYHMMLGSAYAKKGDLAVGRYHLEKAKQLGFHGTDLSNNLAAIKQRLKVQDLSTSKSTSDQFTYYMCRIPRELYWSSSLILGAMALYFILKSNFKRWALCAIILLLATLPTIYERTVVSQTHFAVSLQEGHVSEGPSKIFGDKINLPAGAMVVIGRSVDNWVFIEAPLIYSGWVDRSLLGFY